LSEAPGSRWQKAPVWLAVALYMAAVFALSAQPRLPNLGRYGIRDWMQHYVEYVGLGALTAKAAAVTWPVLSGAGCGGFAIAFGAIYGLSDEIHQKYVPGRSCDRRDWVADFLGAVSGACVFLAWRRFRKRG